MDALFDSVFRSSVALPTAGLVQHSGSVEPRFFTPEMPNSRRRVRLIAAWRPSPDGRLACAWALESDTA